MERVIKRFNVICIAKLLIGEGVDCAHWHDDETIGLAEVVAITDNEMGIEIIRTIVRFKGEDSAIKKVRLGIQEQVVSMVIDRKDGGCDAWELCTDIPKPGNTLDMMALKSTIHRFQCIDTAAT